ncbi:tRNA 5-methoxyuridine(34)/uridine 5-oxyacetic acid(34) synthase CmoB [Gallaecimonas xiamenensis]|uniref:tRNA U34 carboxymethyltransferase n=1 Tax=Gallaecimonas xiamenensis 3-C-1 TaxID=745411 RepID=K2IGN7_9GAMM|nr:tRNA 5-methoxyuridine(34)/uridine 5-oxyacetic acid(34) synthase CmoB [Gallaecimonas xiamenensis]EKE69236.1 tRNA mo(5)U34 methyltransferase [Gallaecimonas xiamenensis 3-C-1]
MNWFQRFYADIAEGQLSHWLEVLPRQLREWEEQSRHGEFRHWQRILSQLPEVGTQHLDIKNGVTIGAPGDLDGGTQKAIEGLLQKFHPWRKGPFDVHGVHIDTEWRSDWKWDRVLPHLSPLKNRFVLDVGCGSGYHLWRMLGEGAWRVVGIDPSDLFLIQFQAIKHFAKAARPQLPIDLLPLGIQQLPELRAFDTVFSMGVLYHRKSPIEHIEQLRAQLKDGGELVLETLVIDGDDTAVLVPKDRYAQMRNVWFLPSAEALKLWVSRCGFKDIKVVDIDSTSIDEQRATAWMRNESLKDFLDPNDPSKTVEGYPAPKRAVLIATAC